MDFREDPYGPMPWCFVFRESLYGPRAVKAHQKILRRMLLVHGWMALPRTRKTHSHQISVSWFLGIGHRAEICALSSNIRHFDVKHNGACSGPCKQNQAQNQSRDFFVAAECVSTLALESQEPRHIRTDGQRNEPTKTLFPFTACFAASPHPVSAHLSILWQLPNINSSSLGLETPQCHPNGPLQSATSKRGELDKPSLSLSIHLSLYIYIFNYWS